MWGSPTQTLRRVSICNPRLHALSWLRLCHFLQSRISPRGHTQSNYSLELHVEFRLANEGKLQFDISTDNHILKPKNAYYFGKDTFQTYDFSHPQVHLYGGDKSHTTTPLHRKLRLTKHTSNYQPSANDLIVRPFKEKSILIPVLSV